MVNLSISQLQKAILDITKCPSLSYSIEGQSFTFDSYMKMLVDALKTLLELRNLLDPFTYKSVAV